MCAQALSPTKLTSLARILWRRKIFIGVISSDPHHPIKYELASLLVCTKVVTERGRIKRLADL